MGDCKVCILIFYGFAGELVFQLEFLIVDYNEVADLSTLDSTTPGTYDVKITVTDFVGNTAEATVQVVVQ